MREQFKNIKGYTGLYMIGNRGSVVSLPRKHQPKIALLEHPRGGTKVDLRKDGNRVTKEVHQLVGGAFVPNPSGKKLIYHLDGNKNNNTAKNLVWVTTKRTPRSDQIEKKFFA